MWPRKNRWLVLCWQGISAAYTKLKELIANHARLAAQAAVVPPASDADGNVAMLPSEPSQAEQEVAACKEDIRSLIQGMYKQLKEELYKDTVPGYESFGDIALAFQLPSVYEDLLRDKLKVSKLAFATSCEPVVWHCLELPHLIPSCFALPCPALASPVAGCA